MKKFTPHPETSGLLKTWNDARLEMAEVQSEIESLQTRVRCLQDRMDDIPCRLENTLFNLSQPIGMRIDDDYIVVVQQTHDDSFTIQTIDFNLREEIKES